MDLLLGLCYPSLLFQILLSLPLILEHSRHVGLEARVWKSIKGEGIREGGNRAVVVGGGRISEVGLYCRCQWLSTKIA